MRIYLAAFFFFISLLFARPSYANRIPDDTTKSVCLQRAYNRLDEAIVLMQKHYYKKDLVNWDSLISCAKKRIETSLNCEEAFETVNWCFRQISETHSFIMPASAAAVYTNDTASLRYTPKLSQVMGELRWEHMKDKAIAYLNIPWISSSDALTCTRIADSIQTLIAQLDQLGATKWIIDLRQNKGGNCWPMLAGIGPLLGEGTCGYFISPSEKLPLIYKDGAAMQGKFVQCQVSRPAYRMKQEKKWITILTGPLTSSSGEILALAFKGKEQVFFFGEPTAGLTTANATYPLSDKSLLVLTVCQEADRSGKIYEGKIFPDQLVSSEKRYAYEDPVKSAAIMWLDMQE